MNWQAGFSKYQLCLIGVFLIIWGIFAINPQTRQNWAFENALVAIFVPIVICTARYFRLSELSYTLIAVYLMLHLVGAYYDYNDVPYGKALGALFGYPERNCYDRLVHFSFGFLLAYPMREVFHRIASVRGFWGYFMPLDLTLSLSAIYELIEWAVVIAVAPEAGATFIGSQGDEWDAQKDIALAGFGAFLAMLVIALFNWWLDPNFWREIGESFKPKNLQPLGEVRLAELIQAHRAAKKSPPEDGIKK